MGFQYFGENNACNDQTKNKCTVNIEIVQRVGYVMLSGILWGYLITCLIIFKKWSFSWQ